MFSIRTNSHNMHDWFYQEEMLLMHREAKKSDTETLNVHINTGVLWCDSDCCNDDCIQYQSLIKDEWNAPASSEIWNGNAHSSFNKCNNKPHLSKCGRYVAFVGWTCTPVNNEHAVFVFDKHLQLQLPKKIK